MLRNEKYTGRVLLQKLSVLALFKSKIKASWIGISILTLIRPLFLTRCSWQCSKRNSAALENRKTKLPWGSRFDIMKKTAGGRVNTKGDWDSSHARSLFDRTASSSCSRLLPGQHRVGGVDQQYRIAGAALFTVDCNAAYTKQLIIVWTGDNILCQAKNVANRNPIITKKSPAERLKVKKQLFQPPTKFK